MHSWMNIKLFLIEYVNHFVTINGYLESEVSNMVCVLYDNTNVLSLKTDNLYCRLLMNDST